MKGIRIRPEKEGLRTSLFDLEADIMEVVWDEAWASFAVSDVHKVLEESRDIAYTTVMTTVKRLHDKGLLDREKDGRRYLYQPLLTRGEFIRQMTRDVLESLPEVGKDEAMAMLVEQVAEADDAELEKLEALIRARRARAKERHSKEIHSKEIHSKEGRSQAERPRETKAGGMPSAQPMEESNG